MLEKIERTLVGVAPLLMHNVQLADPLNPVAQELKRLTKKRNKTEEDIFAIRKVEWLGGLYRDVDGTIGIPSDNILALVIHGARKRKLGKDAAAGVFDAQPFYPLQYKGPRDPERLYESAGFVDYRGAVPRGQGRVMRARPRFSDWKLPIQLAVNTDVIDVESVLLALETAGDVVGLGDWRPRFGRFTLE